MYCSNCGTKLLIDHNFCSQCGSKRSLEGSVMSSGNNCINTICSEIVDSNIHIGDTFNNSNNIDPEILNLKRHIVKLPWSNNGRLTSRSSIFQLGTWGSLASILSLVLPFVTSLNHFPFLSLISFSFFMLILMFSIVLKKFKFTHFQGLKKLESGTNDGVYITKITSDCPWCGSEMKLRFTGPKNNKEDVLLCERNPSQHRIIFDPTVLPEIEE